MANEDKNIELRSEKVRNIIGKIPPILVRYGISIVAVTLLVLFIISVIIPYRETLNLSISIHEKSNMKLIKSVHSGTIIIDTVGSQKDTLQAYMQNKNNIYEVCKCAINNILYSVKSKQFVNKDELLFIINPANNYEIFGIADITKNDSEKIKTGQIVNINIGNDENVQGMISDIYTINPEQTKYRLKINITTDRIYPNSKYEGTVIISEKTVFQKIFK
ncbi:MAG: hypothetical protein LBC68_04850 [Prevotellaceae bacterium]|jgi:hypothetical protein|nr:hypothetical protein [Prevotellaceae bacterium]